MARILIALTLVITTLLCTLKSRKSHKSHESRESRKHETYDYDNQNRPDLRLIPDSSPRHTTIQNDQLDRPSHSSSCNLRPFLHPDPLHPPPPWKIRVLGLVVPTHLLRLTYNRQCTLPPRPFKYRCHDHRQYRNIATTSCALGYPT